MLTVTKDSNTTRRHRDPSGRTVRTLGLFAAALAVAFGVGAALGAAVGPDRPSGVEPTEEHEGH